MTKLAALWRSLSGKVDIPDTVDTDILDYIDQAALWEAAAYGLFELIHEVRKQLWS
jgi:hypothetical protein